jgi:hypothetical protein
MKYFYLLITFFALIFTACREKPATRHEHQTETDELQISLNDGLRWEMDDHTRTMFKAMAGRIEAGGDVNVVGNGLKADLDSLIQGCTMTGEAHDQLHVYLSHLIPAIQEVSESGSDESLKNVEELLNEYPKYFE